MTRTVSPLTSLLTRFALGVLALCAVLCAVALAAGAGIATRQLAFVSQQRSGATDIYVVDTQRLVTSRLTNNDFPKQPPVWSPTGEHLAFSGRSWRGEYPDALYVMDADGRNVRRIARGGTDHLPAWSPDGSQLAFVGAQGGSFRVFVMDVLTNEVRSVTSKSENIAFPIWSPDGARLAFVVVLGREDGLYVVDANGDNERRLTDDMVFTPAWSPDGERIAYTASGTGDSEVYTIDLASSERLNVSQNQAYDSDPVWSPDGMRLAFYSLRECNELSLYVVNADGSDQYRLLNNCALSLRTADNRPPAWSPDGATIALTSQDDGALNIFAVSVADGSIQRLTDFDATIKYPAWRP